MGDTTGLCGCCVDGVCTSETCMRLQGATCADCVHMRRCVTMFGADPSDDACGFYPRRFRRREEASHG